MALKEPLKYAPISGPARYSDLSMVIAMAIVE